MIGRSKPEASADIAAVDTVGDKPVVLDQLSCQLRAVVTSKMGKYDGKVAIVTGKALHWRPDH